VRQGFSWSAEHCEASGQQGTKEEEKDDVEMAHVADNLESHEIGEVLGQKQSNSSC